MKKYDAQKCRILYKRKLAENIFDIRLDASELPKAQPGQFAHIYVPGKTLRRPISICDFESGIMRLVFQVKGEGTQIISEAPIGSELDVLAPLGKGFSLAEPNRKVLFIGGGIGVPPLLFAAKKFGANASVALGFRTAETAVLEADFAKAGCKVFVATDDGSMGYHGSAVACAENAEACEIYACGPMPMLKAVCKLAQQKQISCQISLEERMACGVGACLGCATKLKSADGSWHYGHVCKDGPVFYAQDVCFDD